MYQQPYRCILVAPGHIVAPLQFVDLVHVYIQATAEAVGEADPS